MAEGSFNQENLPVVDPKKDRYLALIKHVLFPYVIWPKMSIIPGEFRRLNKIYDDPQKFEELKIAFEQIFARKYGPDKNALSPKQKEALIKWYGLGDQEAYYCNKDGFWRLSQELNLSRNRLASTFFPKKLKNLPGFN